MNAFHHNCSSWIEAVKHGHASIKDNNGVELPPLDNATLKEFKQRQTCLEGRRKTIDKCTHLLQPKCDSAMVRSAKLLRTRMSAMEAVLKYDPTTLILHIIRDPRGTMMSRKKIHLLAKSLSGNMGREGRALCRQMVEDYYERKRIEKIYPKSFLEVRYEDLTIDLTGTLEKLLSFMSMESNEKLVEQMNKMMYSGKSGSGFSQVRSNATLVASAWRSKIPKDLKSSMDKDCQEVFKVYNYKV